MVALVFAVAPAALADDPSPANYLGLSFTGDGMTPPALELFDAADRAPKAAAYGIQASPSGDAGWSLPLALPPARLAPSLQVSYSSSGGYGWVGRGFSLGGGRRP